MSKPRSSLVASCVSAAVALIGGLAAGLTAFGVSPAREGRVHTGARQTARTDVIRNGNLVFICLAFLFYSALDLIVKFMLDVSTFDKGRLFQHELLTKEWENLAGCDKEGDMS